MSLHRAVLALAPAQDLPAPWRSVAVPSGARPIGPAARADVTGAWVAELDALLAAK